MLHRIFCTHSLRREAQENATKRRSMAITLEELQNANKVESSSSDQWKAWRIDMPGKMEKTPSSPGLMAQSVSSSNLTPSNNVVTRIGLRITAEDILKNLEEEKAKNPAKSEEEKAKTPTKGRASRSGSLSNVSAVDKKKP
jgi:hypothetical protein